MAWQTPKTDWTGADGVRYSDLNRMEGNILELYRGDAARADILLYVSEAGNDITGTGTSAAPYRTINKALSVVPKNLNGKSVSINIAAGLYPESVNIKGFTGPIVLNGAYNAYVDMNNFTVEGCVCIVDTIRIVLVGTGAVVTNGGVLIGTGGLAVSGADVSLTVNQCSRVSLLNVSSTVAESYAVSVDGASHVYIGNLTSEDDNEGILVQGGSIVAVGSSSMSVMGDEVISYAGGRYYTGSQNFSTNTLATAEVVE